MIFLATYDPSKNVEATAMEDEATTAVKVLISNKFCVSECRETDTRARNGFSYKQSCM